jgi:hypothetical protein
MSDSDVVACGHPTQTGPCALGIGHPVGPGFPGDLGHLSAALVDSLQGRGPEPVVRLRARLADAWRGDPELFLARMPVEAVMQAMVGAAIDIGSNQAEREEQIRAASYAAAFKAGIQSAYNNGQF